MRRFNFANYRYLTSFALIGIFLISIWILKNQKGGQAIAANRYFTEVEASARTDWPQWRGINRDGVSLEKNLLKAWPENGPKRLWRISVGNGYSGMSVSHGKLYTLWDAGNAQYLFCLDAATGKELWRHKIDENFINVFGNGPRSTPTIDNDIVYAISSTGKLHAVNALNGTPVWIHDLEQEYGGQIPDYGYSSSPLIQRNKLFVEVGGKDDSAFIAFNKETGDVIWTSQTDLPAYASPFTTTVNGVRQIIFFSASGLFSLSPDNGKLVWKYPWGTKCPATGIPLNTVSPLFIAPDKIFISSGSGTVKGGAVIQIQYQNDSFNVKKMWETKRMKSVLNSSVTHQNHIYGFDGGIFKCLNATTGEVKWKARGFQKGSLILAEDHLIVLGERGKLALVEANPKEFKEKASIQILNGKCWTSPTLAGGRLYLRNNKEMLCLDLNL